jgi:hypothetical protein
LTYDTPQAFRMALEQRLLSRSNATAARLDRLRRRVVFERIVARLQTAEPGRWVLKGGMALEVRLRDEARLSKDIDLGLRDDVVTAEELRERLVEDLSTDDDEDWFVLAVGPVRQLIEDDEGALTWRVKVAAELAGRPFGGIQVDISPRAHELDATDLIPLPNSLDFAGVTVPSIEVIDIHRHAAEKFHGMLKDFGERENTRVRDLVDLVLLCEHDLLESRKLAAAVGRVWAEREGASPPATLPALPSGWPGRYDRLAADHGLKATSLPEAAAILTALWVEAFPTKET